MTFGLSAVAAVSVAAGAVSIGSTLANDFSGGASGGSGGSSSSVFQKLGGAPGTPNGIGGEAPKAPTDVKTQSASVDDKFTPAETYSPQQQIQKWTSIFSGQDNGYGTKY